MLKKALRIPERPPLEFKPKETAIFSGRNLDFFSDLGELKRNKDIKFLDASVNNITSVDPKFIAKYPNLRAFNIAGNQITKLEGLEQQKKLSYIDCSQNRVARIEDIEPNIDLSTIIAYANQIHAVFVRATLIKMDFLDLRSNPMKNINFGHRMPNLTTLLISNCQISDLPDFETFPNLQYLDISRNKICQFTKVKRNKVKVLKIAKNQIDTLKSFKNFRALEVLDVSGNPLEDSGILACGKIPSLQLLRISRTRLHKLSILNKISHNFRVVDAQTTKVEDILNVVEFIIKQPYLEELDLRGTELTIRYYPGSKRDVKGSIDDYNRDHFEHVLARMLYRKQLLEASAGKLKFLDNIPIDQLELNRSPEEIKELFPVEEIETKTETETEIMKEEESLNEKDNANEIEIEISSPKAKAISSPKYNEVTMPIYKEQSVQETNSRNMNEVGLNTDAVDVDTVDMETMTDDLAGSIIDEVMNEKDSNAPSVIDQLVQEEIKSLSSMERNASEGSSDPAKSIDMSFPIPKPSDVRRRDDSSSQVMRGSRWHEMPEKTERSKLAEGSQAKGSSDEKRRKEHRSKRDSPEYQAQKAEELERLDKLRAEKEELEARLNELNAKNNNNQINSVQQPVCQQSSPQIYQMPQQMLQMPQQVNHPVVQTPHPLNLSVPQQGNQPYVQSLMPQQGNQQIVDSMGNPIVFGTPLQVQIPKVEALGQTILPGASIQIPQIQPNAFPQQNPVQYLPLQQQIVSQVPNQPVNTYGSPNQPANAYGSPNQPANTYGSPNQPANTYGSPNQPANTYGSPNQPANTYGSPNQPANAYGSPNQPANAYGSPNQPANTYGSPNQPANAYGSPNQPVNTNMSPAPVGTCGSPNQIQYREAPTQNPNAYGSPTHCNSKSQQQLGCSPSQSQQRYERPLQSPHNQREGFDNICTSPFPAKVTGVRPVAQNGYESVSDYFKEGEIQYSDGKINENLMEDKLNADNENRDPLRDSQRMRHRKTPSSCKSKSKELSERFSPQSEGSIKKKSIDGTPTSLKSLSLHKRRRDATSSSEPNEEQTKSEYDSDAKSDVSSKSDRSSTSSSSSGSSSSSSSRTSYSSSSSSSSSTISSSSSSSKPSKKKNKSKKDKKKKSKDSSESEDEKRKKNSKKKKHKNTDKNDSGYSQSENDEIGKRKKRPSQDKESNSNNEHTNKEMKSKRSNKEKDLSEYSEKQKKHERKKSYSSERKSPKKSDSYEEYSTYVNGHKKVSFEEKPLHRSRHRHSHRNHTRESPSAYSYRSHRAKESRDPHPSSNRSVPADGISPHFSSLISQYRAENEELCKLINRVKSINSHHEEVPPQPSVPSLVNLAKRVTRLEKIAVAGQKLNTVRIEQNGRDEVASLTEGRARVCREFSQKCDACTTPIKPQQLSKPAQPPKPLTMKESEDSILSVCANNPCAFPRQLSTDAYEYSYISAWMTSAFGAEINLNTVTKLPIVQSPSNIVRPVLVLYLCNDPSLYTGKSIPGASIFYRNLIRRPNPMPRAGILCVADMCCVGDGGLRSSLPSASTVAKMNEKHYDTLRYTLDAVECILILDSKRVVPLYEIQF